MKKSNKRNEAAWTISTSKEEIFTQLCQALRHINEDFNFPYNRITHITFYTQSKRLTIYYALFPLHYKQLRPWEVCSLDDPLSFAASHSSRIL